MSFLEGKRALIVGVASERSIATGIAQAMAREGASLAFTYQSEKLKERVEDVAKQTNSKICLPCDVGNDDSINNVFSKLASEWDKIDIIVHSVAYAPQDQLQGEYVETVTREGFKIAHEISSYSFVALAQAALPMLSDTASLLTLSYLGAERIVPNYNVMGLAKASLEANVRYMAGSLGPKGIRVNAISAGPIRTLAAAGIKDFRKMLSYNERVTPLRMNVTIEHVGNSAAFLCSDLAAGITGEILHVDAGFHAIAMAALDLE